jgi:hypothetical protein
MVRPGTIVCCHERNPWRHLWVAVLGGWLVGFALLLTAPVASVIAIAASLAGAVRYHRYFRSRVVANSAELFRRGDVLVAMEHDEEVLVLERDEIVGGFFNDDDRVVLELADGSDIHIGVRDRARAEPLLDDAGVTVKQRVMRVAVAGPLQRTGAGLVLGGIGVAVMGLFCLAQWSRGNLAVAIVTSLLMAITARAIQRREVLVGSDGVMVPRYPIGQRFLPFNSIMRVDENRSFVTLHLTRGESEQLAVRRRDPFMPQVETPADHGEVGALRYRIEQAVARRQLAVEGIGLTTLERGGRSVSAWREALSKAASGGYRTAAVVEQALATVVADPNETPERRVGAVLALQAFGGHREVIAAAARACAEPTLRAALTAGARGEVDVEALDAVEASHRQLRVEVAFDDEDIEAEEDALQAATRRRRRT